MALSHRTKKLRFEPLEDRRMLAGDFELIKDVNVQPASYSSFPRKFVALDDITLFIATTASEGIELWRTDGTPAGTTLVKDVNHGAANGVAGTVPMAAFNGAVYFQGVDAGG